MKLHTLFLVPLIITLLTGCRSKPPIAAWTDQLKSDDSKSRDAAIVEITKSGPTARDAVVPLLTSLPKNVDLLEMASRSEALVAIVKPEDVKAIEAITAATLFSPHDSGLNSQPSVVQMIGILALPKFGAKAVPPLIKALEDNKASNRSRDFAIRLLSEIGPPAKDAITAIESCLKDDELKEVATKALQSIRGNH